MKNQDVEAVTNQAANKEVCKKKRKNGGGVWVSFQISKF